MLFGWNLTVENTTFSSILIRWTNLTNVLNRKVGHYVVFLNRRNHSVSLHQVVDGDQLTTEINGLTYSTNYTVEVVGIDAMGKPYKTPSEATMTANRKRRNATVFLFFVLFCFFLLTGVVQSWTLEKALNFAHLFSFNKGKVLKKMVHVTSLEFFWKLQQIPHKLCFSCFFFPTAVSIDHIFEKKSWKSIEFESKICTNPVLMIRKVLKLATF